MASERRSRDGLSVCFTASLAMLIRVLACTEPRPAKNTVFPATKEPASALATLKARAIIEAAAWKDTLQVRNQRMNVVQADPYSCRLGNKNPESEMGSRNQARPASMMVL